MKKYILLLNLLFVLNKVFAVLPTVPTYVNPVKSINTSLSALNLGDYPTACTVSTPMNQDCWLSVTVGQGQNFYGMLIYDGYTNSGEERKYPYGDSGIREYIMPCNFPAPKPTSFKLYRSSLYNILFNSFQVQPWNPGSANLSWVTVGVLLKAINNSDLSSSGCPGADCKPPIDGATMQIVRRQGDSAIQMYVNCNDKTMLCAVVDGGNPVAQPASGDLYYLANVKF